MSSPGRTESTLDLRSRLRQRRATRATRSRLRTEIASYRTSAERAELAAILARHSEDDVAELEAMLR